LKLVPRLPPLPQASRAALAAAVLGAAAFTSPSSVDAAPDSEDAPDLSWLDRSALDAGDILVRTDRRGAAIGVKAAVLVHAPAKIAWEIVTACELAPEFVPDIVSCRSLGSSDGGRSELFEQTVDAPFFMPRFDHVFRLDYEPYRRIDVHEVRGPLKRLDGTWWLLPEAGGVLLVHELEVEPDIPVPKLFVRIGLKRDLSKTIAAMRARAESDAKAETKTAETKAAEEAAR
jgi:ribosome-associated toxin RatA of RatAB toxin-antitoxin module